MQEKINVELTKNQVDTTDIIIQFCLDKMESCFNLSIIKIISYFVLLLAIFNFNNVLTLADVNVWDIITYWGIIILVYLHGYNNSRRALWLELLSKLKKFNKGI